MLMKTVLNGSNHSGETNRHFRWTEQLVELSVFLFLIVPSMALSFFAVKQGSLSFVLVAIATILRDLALVSLIVFFLWRNGEPTDGIGWTFRNVRLDIALAIGVFILLFLGSSLLESALKAAGLSTPSTPLPSFLAGKGAAEFVLASFMIVVVAFAEETIFRGYLILRFKAVTGSLPAAILLSAVVFSLGHGYEGSAGVITVGVMGLLFALVYVWRQSLVAPMAMHFLQDFISIVLVPMLGMK